MATISIDRLTVDFAVYGSSSRSLKNTVMAQATGGRVMSSARDVVSVRAIDDFSLEIKSGDRVGLIGHNGSGKTTLLRVLAGIYKPFAGQVTIEGSVGALLDPAAGMDHDATGLDNVFLRGHLLGMSRQQIESSLESIAQFTELGDFLALPLKTYSAGMATRLAFAISTTMHNDILLIDEGIGAGDAAFQDKVQRRIEDLFERARIVVLASHSGELIRRFCNRTVEMSHGRLRQDVRMADLTGATRP